jgi:glyoxylase-like metal-dependent hydrolase (beta-lactamase superfamily II)
MIDAGPPSSEQAIEDWLKDIAIRPSEVQLVVLTHGHTDHVGSALGIKQFTGAKIAIHEDDRESLENGVLVWPRAVTTWGRFVRMALKPFKAMFRFPGVRADVVFGDDGLSLVEYGITGRVIHTPGHTSGSVSVLLETGDAFVGCMTHNALPFRFSPGLPIFAEDLPQLRESWKLLLEQGAQTIHPAHGGAFPAEDIRTFLC